ncbi:MAG: class I SAM-dependent methyltransferase [Ardenticatenaceae bacterium]|nr:class I SAM-dependent methyltransferase [Ardenticatenaceae bacterium]
MTADIYDKIAHYYDLTHAALTEDIPYILQVARQSAGPVLELGCGSGRLLLPLAEAGHTVFGVDNSPVMLARAQARVQQLPPAQAARAQVLLADMTQLTLTPAQPFGLALLPYNTAMHLPLPQLTQTLRRVKGYVQGNGRFFIDLANPFIVAATPNDRMLTLENVLTDPDTGETIVQMAANWLDEEAQILHITWLYDASPAAGGAVQRTVAQVDYHYLYPHQVEMALHDAGWRIVRMSGDYADTPFDEESERLLVLAAPG